MGEVFVLILTFITDLNNIVGFKAVDKNGNLMSQVTVDEMTELVSARIVSAASEISTFAAAAGLRNR